jgi:hypothetical protein
MLPLLFALAALAGCGDDYTKPVVSTTGPASAAQKNFDRLWDGSMEVLRQYDFAIALQVRRQGRIETEPLIGKSWFEFWRKDSASAEDTRESSLQKIYRTVKINIEAAGDDPDKFVALVTVETSRSDRGGAQLSGTSAAYDMFVLPNSEAKPNGKLLLDTGKDENGNAVGGNTPLGRDHKLEQKIADAIVAQVHKAAAKPAGL